MDSAPYYQYVLQNFNVIMRNVFGLFMASPVEGSGGTVRNRIVLEHFEVSCLVTLRVIKRIRLFAAEKMKKETISLLVLLI
jgi:hypothetical protein